MSSPSGSGPRVTVTFTLPGWPQAGTTGDPLKAIGGPLFTAWACAVAVDANAIAAATAQRTPKKRLRERTGPTYVGRDCVRSVPPVRSPSRLSPILVAACFAVGVVHAMVCSLRGFKAETVTRPVWLTADRHFGRSGQLCSRCRRRMTARPPNGDERDPDKHGPCRRRTSYGECYSAGGDRRLA